MNIEKAVSRRTGIWLLLRVVLEANKRRTQGALIFILGNMNSSLRCHFRFLMSGFNTWLGVALVAIAASASFDAAADNESLSLNETPFISLPKSRLGANEMAVLVNDSDPQSVEVARYYLIARKIETAQLIHLHFDGDQDSLKPKEFARIKQQIDAQAPAMAQALAITWSRPFRVGCMSITSALTFGYQENFCALKQCRANAPMNPLLNSPTVAPFSDFGIRPAMMLAGKDATSVRTLIDRGVAADGTAPAGTTYLLSTNDKARNVRAVRFAETSRELDGLLQTQIISGDSLIDRDDVIGYFTGVARVAGLERVRFLPGAIADHLTSHGGDLFHSSQMSSLEWLNAGATGSYGTVVEPCNYPAKFPDPLLAMGYYAKGATLLEAYWKSVAWPWEGLFIGEPLATPFDSTKVTASDSTITLETRRLQAGDYRVQTSESILGPFRNEEIGLHATLNQRQFTLPNLHARIYRLVDMNAAAQ